MAVWIVVYLCIMKKQKKIIVANWKMNPQSVGEAVKLFEGIKKTASTLRNVQSVVCPPSIFLSDLQKLVGGHRCVLGAQNTHHETSGSFTGEIGIAQLKKAGAKYIITGHSERRSAGETNEDVAKKTTAILKNGLHAIVCVGEIERDEHAEYLSFIRKELEESLSGVPQKYAEKLIIAYEPVWAVGVKSTKADTPEDAVEMILFIRKILTGIFNKKIAFEVPVLYGGSVNRKNAHSFIVTGEVDGFLIGRASLDAKHFCEILDTVNNIR